VEHPLSKVEHPLSKVEHPLSKKGGLFSIIQYIQKGGTLKCAPNIIKNTHYYPYTRFSLSFIYMSRLLFRCWFVAWLPLVQCLLSFFVGRAGLLWLVGLFCLLRV